MGVKQIYQTIQATLPRCMLEPTQLQDIDDNESRAARLLSTIEETIPTLEKEGEERLQSKINNHTVYAKEGCK